MPERPEPVPPSAAEEMSRVLAVDPVETRIRLGRSAITVQRWRHEALHGRTQPMADHVFMTYLGVPRAIERGEGCRCTRGWTQKTSVTSIAAGEDARWEIDGGLDAVHVYVRPEALQELAAQHGLGASDLIERTADTDVRGAQILRMLLPGADGGAPDTLFVEQAADLLAIHLLTSHCGGGRQVRRDSRGGLAPHVLRRVQEHAEADLAARLSLSELAADTGLSTFHFCRAFKQSTGVAPHRWVRLRRLARAVDLLRTTALPITEVAARVGFDDPSLLARLFNKELGSTPRSVRQEALRDRRSAI